MVAEAEVAAATPAAVEGTASDARLLHTAWFPGKRITEENMNSAGISVTVQALSESWLTS